MKRYGWISLGVALLDQAIKICVRKIPYGYTFFEIRDMISLTHCVNTGAAFSILSGKTILLTAMSLVLLGAICVYVLGKMRLTPIACVAFACILGGGMGNLIDRILFGGVTDYIRLLWIDFPVFNLADVAITCGVMALMLMLLTSAFPHSVTQSMLSLLCTR